MAKVDDQGVAAIKRAGMIAAARVLLPRARSGARWGGPGMVTVAGGRPQAGEGVRGGRSTKASSETQ